MILKESQSYRKKNRRKKSRNIRKKFMYVTNINMLEKSTHNLYFFNQQYQNIKLYICTIMYIIYI